MKVNLIYFKRTGKFYSEGTYETKETNLGNIWEEVSTMRNNKNLPGLVVGCSDFIVSIDVPDHPYNHPHLFI